LSALEHVCVNTMTCFFIF